MEAFQQHHTNTTVLLENVKDAIPASFTYIHVLYQWLITTFPMLSLPYIQDSIRLLFLGSIIETGRSLGNWAIHRVRTSFSVTAHFAQGDHALEWMIAFVNAQQLWTESHDISISAVNPHRTWASKKELGRTPDHGFAQARYTPTSVAFELFRWRTYLVKVKREQSVNSYQNRTNGYSDGATQGLTITVYTPRTSVLQQLVEDARSFYEKSTLPPVAAQNPGGLLVTAYFEQGDVTYDWLMDFFIAHKIWAETMDVKVTSKERSKRWGMAIKSSQPTPVVNVNDEKHSESGDIETRLTTKAYYEPVNNSPQAPQLFNWKGTWVNVQYDPGHMDWQSNREIGGRLTIKLFTTNREVLDDLIDAAAQRFQEAGTRQIIIHMSNTYEWARTIFKQPRPLNSVILPPGIQEMLLADSREFLSSKAWYSRAGIPHRRGYLLWGSPGTGKSTTIHALAGELGLEIYSLSLSNTALDDNSLQNLIALTPENCIILIEDIDCAFPTSREEEEIEQGLVDPFGVGANMGSNSPKSMVTLAGLLNLLDSVTSEEGRLIFATTNHIDQLDPALLRPGRMDVKIQYKLATRNQAERLFRQFFPTALDEIEALTTSADREASNMSSASSDTLIPSGQNTGAPGSTPLRHSSDLPPTDQNPFIISSKTSGAYAAGITTTQINELAAKFADILPESEFSMAELQGYLLRKKWDPIGAVDGLAAWLEERKVEKEEREERARKKEETRKKRLKAKRENLEMLLKDDKSDGDVEASQEKDEEI